MREYRHTHGRSFLMVSGTLLPIIQCKPRPPVVSDDWRASVERILECGLAIQTLYLTATWGKRVWTTAFTRFVPFLQILEEHVQLMRVGVVYV